jgi:sugar phosphate isomerase/epimerase
MVRFGFSLQDSYILPTAEVIDLLADTGFCAISPAWKRNSDLAETVRQAQKRNLEIQSLHGPLRGMPAMWSHDPSTAAPILQDLLQSAADGAELDIPLLVVHPWNGLNYTFSRESLCFDHFDTLVEHAARKGIRIAFENLEGAEYLAALLERYADCDTVGFCWDSGHELCYAPGRDFLKPYGDRLVMTHLNDNLGVTDPEGRLQGTDDLHLLPYDGVIDWEDTVRRLKSAKSQKILNFELKIRPKGDRCTLDLYSKLPLRQYIEQSYERACRAAETYFE